MPLPKPRKNEKQKDFIDRCMGDGVMRDEYPDASRRRAVCQSQWDKDKKAQMNIDDMSGNIYVPLRQSAPADNSYVPVRQYSALPVLLDYVTSRDWAMDLGILQQMAEIVDRHIRGERLSAEQIEAVTQVRADKEAFDFRITGTTAVIPVSGVIAKYSRMVNGCSQARGTSIETLTGQLDAAMNDHGVRSIMLHIESPGGSIDGVADFADRVYEASFDKPITAFADDLCASAAYWIASQANAVYANRAGDVGSLGVYTLYVDTSEAAKKQGLKFHIFRSGEHKGVGAPGIAITEANMAEIQERIDGKFELFLGAVLRGRAGSGLIEDELRAIADGRTFLAGQAMAHNLIDGIGTIDEALRADPPAVRDTIAVSAESAESINTKTKENTMNTEKEQAGALCEQEVTEMATKVERQRIEAITAALPDAAFNDCRTKAIATGQTPIEAKAAAFDVAIARHKSELAAVQAKLDEAENRLKAIRAGGSDIGGPGASDADEQGGGVSGDDGKAETYAAAVARFQADAKMSEAQAMAQAARKFPKSHEAWKDTHIVR